MRFASDKLFQNRTTLVVRNLHSKSHLTQHENHTTTSNSVSPSNSNEITAATTDGFTDNNEFWWNGTLKIDDEKLPRNLNSQYKNRPQDSYRSYLHTQAKNKRD
jgi:mevalonate pyrophosphate decarboxylase